MLLKDNSLVIAKSLPKVTLPLPFNFKVPSKVSAEDDALNINVLAELPFNTNVAVEEPTNKPEPETVPFIVNELVPRLNVAPFATVRLVNVVDPLITGYLPELTVLIEM